MYTNRIVIGLTEKIKINGKEIAAKIDTGAAYNSICSSLASKLKLGPIIKSVAIRSSHGSTRRPVVKANVEIKGKVFETEFTIASRMHMRYQVLIGQNLLSRGFFIDPNKQ